MRLFSDLAINNTYPDKRFNQQIRFLKMHSKSEKSFNQEKAPLVTLTLCI